MTVQRAEVLLGQAADLIDPLVDEITSGHVPEWQHMFRLAQRLQGLPGIAEIFHRWPDAFSDLVRRFLEAMDAAGGLGVVDITDDLVADCFSDLVDCWDKVRDPGGRGALYAAFVFAGTHPIKLLPPVPQRLGWKFLRVVSTAYHLQTYRGSEPIYLPVERLAQLLTEANTSVEDDIDRKVSHSLVSRHLGIATKYGLLRPHNSDYSYKKRQCKEYYFELNCPHYQRPPGRRVPA